MTATGIQRTPHQPLTRLAAQHDTFSVGERPLDSSTTASSNAGLEHWADPRQHHAHEISDHDGVREAHFLSNDGHDPEIITRV